MKKAVSSVDLCAIINELQFLSKGKLSQVYHPQRDLFYLQFHVTGKGKQLLRLIPGKLMNLVSEKLAAKAPSGLAMLMRKHILGAWVKNIYQHESERIVVIEFEKKSEDKLKVYRLIVEFFSKGNLAFVNSDWEVLGLLNRAVRESRVVTHKKKYEFPPKQINWKEISLKEFSELILKSEKRNLATSIATDIGMGGLYAEEICVLAKVDSKVAVNSLEKSDLKKLYLALEEIRKLVEKSKGFVYEKEIVPFELVSAKENLKIGKLKSEKKSFNLSLANIDPLVKVSPFEKKIEATKKVVEKQKLAVLDIEKKILKNTEIGNKVYENYAKLQKLIDVVLEVAKEKGWGAVNEELSKLKKVKKVDLKNKKIELEI